MLEAPPFVVLGPQEMARPVLLAVPHAGRAYSSALLAAARVPLATLRRLEDSRADLLVQAAISAGFTVVVAQAPRAYIDLNRAESDMDPLAMADALPGLAPSHRARAGLGLIPHRLVPEGLLWREALSAGDLEHRLQIVHRPYHAAIDELLGKARAQWGAAAFIDVHSMPTPVDPIDVAFGDRFGLTASGALVDQLLAVVEGHGFAAARNHPYAGAFGIERHGHRRSGSEALQLEIARQLYLDQDGWPDVAGVARLGALVRAIAETTEASLRGGQEMLAIAAE